MSATVTNTDRADFTDGTSATHTATSNDSFVVHIVNKTPIINDNSALVSITKGADAAEPSTPGRFRVALSSASSSATVVNYRVAGSAAASDYKSLSGSVTIPASTLSTNIDVTVVDDLIAEPTETVILTLVSITSGGPGVTISPAQGTARLNIADNDGARGCNAAVTLIDGALTIVGTDNEDRVTIHKDSDTFRVHASFLNDDAQKRHKEETEKDDDDDDDGDDDNFGGGFRIFNAAAVSSIVATLCEGNDRMQIAGNIRTTTSVDGGGGHDQIKAGAGPSVLYGGAGNDSLDGGAGRNILIGGKGQDRLVGGPNDDILIGGSTTYDPHSSALFAILAEWNSDQSYGTRVVNIIGPSSPQQPTGSSYLRDGNNVFDDGDSDRLTGLAGQDWFFGLLAENQFTDRKNSERLNV